MSVNKLLRYYKTSIFFSIVGLIVAYLIGYFYNGQINAGLTTLWECFVLAILEISLSFDNAIVNARIVRDMDKKWQKRFLFIGIVIAVFGMRMLLPIIIVVLVLHKGLFSVVHMALYDPETYKQALEHSKLTLHIFGGSFLTLVALDFFFDKNKDVHWISFIEKRLVNLKYSWLFPFAINCILVAIIFCVGYILGIWGSDVIYPFVISFAFANITYYSIELLSRNLNNYDSNSSGLKSFCYLEILDASFSFDGVLGAFALSDNFLIIALGLGIGAFYVRSMTLMLVHENTLAKVLYIEHGAFYAILFLAIIMFVKLVEEVPDYVTGICSLLFIVLSIFCSRYIKRLDT